MNIRQLKEEVVLTGCASDDKFVRMPDSTIEKVPRLRDLAHNTSGIKTSFETDSKRLRLTAKVGKVTGHVHMAVSAASGFDIYVNGKFLGNLRPEYNGTDIEGELELDTGATAGKVEIYFPLYNSVVDFNIELDKGAFKRKTAENMKPVLFYGSSITQGACASRPGNSYVNMTGRMLGRPVINLGFSGSARGDIPLAEYIASLDIAAFVYDYDHNAPDTAFLKETHEPFFKALRAKKPNLPVIMMSRPGYEKWIRIAKGNTQVVMTTYLNALSAGDDNVYFIDGRTLFGESDRDACSVDGTHPNDIGFIRMARRVSAVLEGILED